jgi:hypothetical protein
MQAIGRSAPFLVLMVVAFYLLTLTWQFEFPRAPGRLGPDVWPQALLVLLIIACAAGIVSNVWASLRAGEGAIESPTPMAQPGTTELDEPEVPSRYGLVVAGMAMFLAYPVALEYLGFVAATFLLMALFMWVGQWRNPLGVMAVSALGTLGLFYIFRGVVYVSLPLGVVEPFRSATLWIADAMGMR